MMMNAQKQLASLSRRRLKWMNPLFKTMLFLLKKRREICYLYHYLSFLVLKLFNTFLKIIFSSFLGWLMLMLSVVFGDYDGLPCFMNG